MKICPICKKQYESGNFCENCETEDGMPVKLEEYKVTCPQCGRKYDLGTKFCSECGVRLTDNSKNNSQQCDGIAIGDKNVIAGDVIGKNESYTVSGNATIVHNEDETKKTAECHICGKVLPRIQGYNCPECGEFTCKSCFDEEEKKCGKCTKEDSEKKLSFYQEKLKDVLADGKIDFFERFELNKLKNILNISDETAEKMEEPLLSDKMQVIPELSTNENRLLNEASSLFYDQNEVEEAMNRIKILFYKHKENESVFELYHEILFVCDPCEFIETIEDYQFDMDLFSTARIRYLLKLGKIDDAEYMLIEAEKKWTKSIPVKCCRILLNLYFYNLYKEENFLTEAEKLYNKITDTDNKKDRSWKLKTLLLINESKGVSHEEVDSQFCEKNNVYYGILVRNLFPEYSLLRVGKNQRIQKIQDGINLIKDNGVIEIDPGTYKENLEFTKDLIMRSSYKEYNSIMSCRIDQIPLIEMEVNICKINHQVQFEGIIFTDEPCINYEVSIEDYKSKDLNEHESWKKWSKKRDVFYSLTYGWLECGLKGYEGFQDLFLMEVKESCIFKDCCFLNIGESAIKFVNGKSQLISTIFKNICLNSCVCDDSSEVSIVKCIFTNTEYSHRKQNIKTKGNSCIIIKDLREASLQFIHVMSCNESKVILRNSEFNPESLSIYEFFDDAMFQAYNCNGLRSVELNDFSSCEINCSSLKSLDMYCRTSAKVMNSKIDGLTTLDECSCHIEKSELTKPYISDLSQVTILDSVLSLEKEHIDFPEKTSVIIRNCKINDEVYNFSKSYEKGKNIPAPLIHIEKGSFLVPAWKYDDSYKVNVERDFLVSEYYVTQKEFQDVMGYNPVKEKTNNYAPVFNVNWYEAITYCNKRSIKEGFDPFYSIQQELAPNILNDINNISVNTIVKVNNNANGYRLLTEQELLFSYGEDLAELGHPDGDWSYLGDRFGGFNGNKKQFYLSVLQNNEELEISQICGWSFGSEWCWSWYDDESNKLPKKGQSTVFSPILHLNNKNIDRRKKGIAFQIPFFRYDGTLKQELEEYPYYISFRVARNCEQH